MKVYVCTKKIVGRFCGILCFDLKELEDVVVGIDSVPTVFTELHGCKLWHLMPRRDCVCRLWHPVPRCLCVHENEILIDQELHIC